MSGHTPKILAVMSDLMFTVKILDAAKKFGVKVEFLKDKEIARSKLREHPALAIFDLNYEAADPLGIITELKADSALRDIPTVGFVSHVQVELRNRAQESGCDVVVPRSVFAQNLPEILGRYFNAAA